MNLVFIHGPAASGKLTVARELARLTGFGVFHNHLVVDSLTPVFEFGSEPFRRLRELRSPALSRELSSSGAFDYPELPSSGLTIDTEHTGPGAAAARIREFFTLTPVTPGSG